MSKFVLGITLFLLLALILSACSVPATPTATSEPVSTATAVPTIIPTATPDPTPTPQPLSPLAIEYMRQQEYPGSDITIEQTLNPGSNYNRYVVSYKSDGLKIYALMTVPKGVKPKTGFPAIIFNHGYIQPNLYRTTERYVAYVDALAKSGYIVFKSDYRGNGNSEGEPGGHFSPAYTIDVFNALGSLKKYADADPNRIGMWGHSLGGDITLRAIVISKDIKAGVIWAGTVGLYAEQTNMWGRRHGSQGGPVPGSTPSAQQGLEQFGTPQQNPQFWDSISPNNYVADLSGPLQLHHGTADQEVPLRFSQALYDQVKTVGKSVEFYTYPGSDHNISQGFALAMQRTIAFFAKYLK